MFVCVLVTTVKPAKTAEPIEMLLGIWTRMELRNCMFDGCPDPLMERGPFGGIMYPIPLWQCTHPVFASASVLQVLTVQPFA